MAAKRMARAKAKRRHRPIKSAHPCTACGAWHDAQRRAHRSAPCGCTCHEPEIMGEMEWPDRYSLAEFARTPRVMVYGTLRTGKGNRAVIEPCAASTVPARLDEYRLIDPQGFPAIRRCPGGWVTGELVTLRPDALETAHARLDALEGVPRSYTRARVLVTPHGGQATTAWVYVWAREGERAWERAQVEGDGQDVWGWS